VARTRSTATLLASTIAATLLLVHPAAQPVAAQPRNDSAARASKERPCNPKKQVCDTVAPALSIQAPAEGASLTGHVEVNGTATDNIGVALVEVRVDDGAFVRASGTTSWSALLDTGRYVPGPHTIGARAADAAGNYSAETRVQVHFIEPPALLTVTDVRIDRPTIVALGVQVLVSGDANRNGQVALSYRPQGSSDWRSALPPLRVLPETVYVAVPEQFAGSLFDLSPATTYEIRVWAADPDGGEPFETTLTATTRPVPRAEPQMPRIVTVRDATALRAALSAAVAGDVIVLGDGIYTGSFVLGASGTPSDPIVLRGARAGAAILDGANCKGCNVLEVAGSYVHVERLTIRNGFRGLRFTGADAIGNVARHLAIQNGGHGTAGFAGQRDFYICDNAIDGRLQWPWVFERDATKHWDDRGIEVTGDGHVVCHNTIRGFGDPVVNKKRQARSWDVYGNDIADAWDGVELDEGEGNVRMFWNRFTNVMAPVSIQPVFGGPAYVLRNVAYNSPDEPIKLKSLGGVEEPSGALVYHNTFVSPSRALNLLSTITQHNFVIGNNLFVGPATLADARAVDWRARIDRGVFDYNGYYPDGAFMFGTTTAGVDRLYDDFAAVTASGAVESHGVLLDPDVFEGLFVGPADPRLRYDPPDFMLHAASAAIDRGERLPGVNDGHTGEAPDLGALEVGCGRPVYGPRPEGLDGVTARIDCP
jgi:hypothetical protein